MATHLGETDSDQSYDSRTSLSSSQLTRPRQMNLKFKGWGQFARTALHHKNPQRRPKDLSMSMSNPKVLQRWAQGESGRWKMSLEAVVSNLHVGGSELWLLCCRLGGDGNARQHPE
ncbi:hypothetical protein ElyMa_001593600 [Elysia marginata]|uniref:Uncharacterized protein n=1 Tax=Elysia marginata TaxID=1093978 RepID=A0AAV4JIV6_9GAST|nr:hypothetical protein ElyMa_001593600 [Elysia marginata]